MTRFRLLFLALPLFLVLGQGCFATEPTPVWNGLSFERMSVDDCVHWSAHALEEAGFTSAIDGNVATGHKDPHTAVVFCNAAPLLTIVIASNASFDDALHEREAFERSMQRIARHRGRDRDWDHRR